MSTIVKLAAAVMAVYGVISIAGGVIGYVVTSRAGKPSVASIAAGGPCGVVLVVYAALMMFRKPLWPAIVAIIVAVLLLGRFVPKVITASPTAPQQGYRMDGTRRPGLCRWPW